HVLRHGGGHPARACSGGQHDVGAAQPRRSGESAVRGLSARALELRLAALCSRRAQDRVRPHAARHFSSGAATGGAAGRGLTRNAACAAAVDILLQRTCPFQERTVPVPPPQSTPPRTPFNQFNLWYLMLAILGVLWVRDIWMSMRQIEPIPYSEFVQQLKQGKVKEIAIADNTIQGTYKAPTAEG